MPVQYYNRKGQKYFLHEGTTKKGNPRYYFSKKADGTLAERLPEGYEIYEKPENAQVYVRKSQKTPITSDERNFVADQVRKLAQLEPIVEAEKNAIVVYLPNRTRADVTALFKELRQCPSTADFVDDYLQKSHYEKLMQFVLCDEEKRLYMVERWCFRGSIDRWIHLDGPDELPPLVNQYVVHLGKESFFDLMGF